VAGPLRFRRSEESWSERRVRQQLLAPLQSTFGAVLGSTRHDAPEGFTGRRLDMENGDFALFLWNDGDGAYWMGNTETPRALWQTEKYAFHEAPYPVARWAQRELLADLREQSPWLVDYPHVSWFFLPVFLSKDGRESTRAFFREHAAGFPDADSEAALEFYERFLRTGVLDEHRETMAGKLGTSPHVDMTRMGAAMAEFTAAKLLYDAGHEFVPEVQLDSGHALDFIVDGQHLVEVTRPRAPGRRSANTSRAALRATTDAKRDGQLDAHPGALLLVDCSSFRDDEWNPVAAERPAVGHTPAVVYRARPNGSVQGYAKGSPAVDLSGAIRWV
jgi:hypothetical protein